jgi:hypothetical protein
MWEKRFRILMWLGVPAAFGLAIVLGNFISGLMDRVPSTAFTIVGVLLVAPGLIYLYLLTFWHWKSRYRGHHSDLWGALLCLETTGWFKLVYLFRHMLPDMRARGRYMRTSTGEMPTLPPDTL